MRTNLNRKSSGSVDHVVTAQRALQWLNLARTVRWARGAKQRAAVTQLGHVPDAHDIMSRWRDYGAGLLSGRAQQSTEAFGAWTHDNALDVGVAESHAERSEAMWLAEHWNDIDSIDVSNVLLPPQRRYPMPTAIRQECRKAGYEWAETTNHE